MANVFSLILVIATLTTGLLWCLNKLTFVIKRCKQQQVTIQKVIDNQIISKTPKATRSKLCWLETGASIFPMLLTVLIVRSFIFEPFKIPSGSMMPSLLINDFILVEKFAYGFKDPIFHKTLIKTGHPKRSDIVVFKYPGNPHLDYIKRAIGLPGDIVIYNPIAKEIIIKPGCSSLAFCKHTLPIKYSNVALSDFVQTFDRRNNGEVISSFFQKSKNKTENNGIRMIERKEILDNIMHHILVTPVMQDQLSMYYQQEGQQLATWKVPTGHYFMMGDNRDNSSDSRYWGFVPEANLIGKATIIWMSFDKEKGKWPTGLRLDRIGRIH